MDIDGLVGQHLVIGVPGTRVSDAIVRQFRDTRAGGLILFRPNCESPQQITAFIRDLEEALQRRLLILVDHEGGRVIHLPPSAATVFPSALAVGATGDPTYAERQGRIEAAELRRLGVDVSLGPVLDVLTEAYSPNIGIRAYGRDAHLVARMGVARIRAMQAAGLSACAKHFPGKGHATVDAHLSMPVVSSTWKEMEQTHLVPFRRAIEAGVDLVMTSHPLYPNLDSSPHAIATFSRRIVTDYLREELNYTGLITSDDLEMGAIKELCGVGEAAVRAVAAGHDLVLACHDAIAQREAAEALRDAYRHGTLKRHTLEQTVERLHWLAQRRPERFAPGDLACEPDGAPLAQEIAHRAAQRLCGRPLSCQAIRSARVACIVPKLSTMADRIMIEPEVMDEAAFIRSLFAPLGLSPMLATVALEPTEPEIAAAVGLAQLADLTILYLFDAHLYPSNRRLLEALQETGKRLAVVLLRNPWDAEWVNEPAICAAASAPRGSLTARSCATAFGFRACELRAATTALFDSP